ncbi:MAG: hypothetical protein AAF362_05255 [Pseudomonadota bacterium]
MRGHSHFEYPTTSGKQFQRHLIAGSTYFSPKKRKKSKKKNKSDQTEAKGGLEIDAKLRSVYLIDTRRLFRECVCRNLQSILPDIKLHETAHINGFFDDSPSPDGILMSIGEASTAMQSVKDDLMKLKRRLDPVPVILLTDDEDYDLALAALRNGIKGYFPASLSTELLARAVQLVLAGGTFVPPKLLQEWVKSGTTGNRHSSKHH